MRQKSRILKTVKVPTGSGYQRENTLHSILLLDLKKKKSHSGKKQSHFQGKENKIVMSLTATFCARKENNIFKISKERKCEPRILYPVNLSSIKDAETCTKCRNSGTIFPRVLPEKSTGEQTSTRVWRNTDLRTGVSFGVRMGQCAGGGGVHCSVGPMCLQRRGTAGVIQKTAAVVSQDLNGSAASVSVRLVCSKG